MQQLFVLTTLVVVGFCSMDSQRYCHGLQCPNYEEQKLSPSNPGFETRIYPKTSWITTKIDSTESKDALAACSRLEKYCAKHVEAGKSISKSWPVLINATMDGVYFLSWFVPPGTTAKDDPALSVKVTQQPASTVYVRSFDGIPSLEKGQENAKILRRALMQAEDQGAYTGAIYDSYFSLTHHNEVWIFAK